MPEKPALGKLLQSTPQLWKGRQANRSQRTVSSGHARLDARLPGHGWPLGAVSELITGEAGLGEFRLLFPALAELGRQGQWIILVNPPWTPYPAALHGHGLPLERLLLIQARDAKESLWACEQALRNGRGGAVLAWPERISFARLRRLQLAAAENAKLAFLFRPEKALQEPSPAALRLQLEADEQLDTRVRIVKSRGSHPPQPLRIPHPFSTYAKQQFQTEGHDPSQQQTTDATLARHPLSPPGAGPVHPGPKRTASPPGSQRYH